MEHREQILVAGAFLVGTALLMSSCGDDLSSPVAPSPVGTSSASSPPTASVGPDVLAGLLGDDSSAVHVEVSATQQRDAQAGLKVSRPEPLEPVDDIETDSLRPLLVASNATATYGENLKYEFGYEFVIATAMGDGVVELESGRGNARDGGATSYQVQTTLNLGAAYTWRVRPVLENAFGEWSTDAFFRTVPVGFPTPLRQVSPREGAVVGSRPLFVVRSGEVEGDVTRASIQVRLTEAGSDFTDRERRRGSGYGNGGGR